MQLKRKDATSKHLGKTPEHLAAGQNIVTSCSWAEKQNTL
jgi:hypothetical protein